jgi:hypothetical protein
METQFTRRSLLLLAGAGLAGVRLNAASGEFWNKRPPSQWTREEIDLLITKSPWAKTVKATYAPGENPSSNDSGYPNGNGGGGYPPNSGGGYPNGGGYPGGRSRGGMGIPGIGGLSIPGLGGGGRPRNGGGSRGQTSPYEGTVRWESALPIQDAMKSGPPEQLEGHYAISVNGIPLMGGARYQGEDDSASSRKQEQDDMDRLKGLSSLQVKGKDHVQAGVALRQVSSGSSFLIGFSKELLPLHTQDSEVIFTSQIGRLVVKAQFLLKEMQYHGELAV